MSSLPKLREELRGIVLALLLVAVMTVVMVLVIQFVQPTNRSVVFLIPVIAAASLWGVTPALVAAFAGIVAAVFFFYPPHYTFKIPKTPQMVNLGLFLVIALVTGRLATASRKQAEQARKRENEVRELYAFTRRLNTARADSDIFAAIQDHLSSLTQRKSVLFESDTADPVDTGRPAASSIPEAVHSEVVKYAEGQAPLATASVVDDGTGNIWLVRHLVPNTPTFGVIAVDLGRKADGETDDVRQRVDGVLEEAAATFDRLDVARVIDDARMRTETEQLREALIGSVSHELRTPLASILGSSTVLGNMPKVAEDERLRALADVIRDEAERLNSDIQNLLDATRITSQSLRPRHQWLEPSDVVNSALGRRRRRLAEHVIESDVAEDLPLIYGDPVLIEQALVQLLDNAAKYSPPGTVIGVMARHESDGIVLSVSDQGAGFTAEERQHVGERFFRGRRHLASIPGSGLGLWIANAFVTASGGELLTSSGGAGHGSKVSIRLPIAVTGALHLEREIDE